MRKQLTVATRQSALALTQTGHVCDRLAEAWPGLAIETLHFTTRGDQIINVTLSKIGGKGLFTQELEAALLDGRGDFAVHSLKDMPSDLPAGLVLGAIPVRHDPRDVLISRGRVPFADLKLGAKVGTSSLRRALCLKDIRPDLEIHSLRGNIDTRIRKLETEGLDAIVLAGAGLMRMGWEDRITEYLPVEKMLPAVGQGALAIECREYDEELLQMLSVLEDSTTRLTTSAERTFLKRLNGGCQVPIAGFAEVSADGTILFRGLVGHPDGSRVLRCELKGLDPLDVGHQAAEELLAQGAGEILAAIKEG